MTRFLHITDLHISAPETDDPGRQTDTPATLRRLVEVAGSLNPDFVIASGDLTNLGDPASYRLLAEIMSGLSVPVIYALGNHDKRAPFHAAFSGLPGAPDGPLDHDLVVAGHHIIALDSSVPGQVSGDLDDAQFDRLTEMLSRHGDLPRIVVLHHPPRTDPDQPYVWASLSEPVTQRLGEALSEQGVQAILSGHIHVNRVSLWRGIPLVVAAGQQSSVDLTASQGLRIVEGTSFAICDMLPGGPQVSFVPLADQTLIKEIPDDVLRGFA